MYTIIGASGYLGSYFMRDILTHTDDSILAVARHTPPESNKRITWLPCDVTRQNDVEELCKEVNNYAGGGCSVIYLAAAHNPDYVEQNPRDAWNTNVTALSVFLNMAQNVDRLVYASTDSVYGESANGRRFRETDRPAPVNRYGVQKSVSEALVLGYGYQVVRYPFLIGPSLATGKKHFYDRIVESLKTGNEIEMFADSRRSALRFDSAARLTMELLQKDDAPRLVNVCGDDDLSKYEIGLMIARAYGLSEDLVKPISISSSGGIFQTKRAASTLMDNTLLKETLNISSVRLSFG